MEPLKWSDKLSVGIDEIDLQHKKWLAIVNELFDGVKNQKGNRFIGDIINRLFDYAKIHFALEEKYMTAFSYEGLAEHRKEHELLIKRLTEINGKFDPNIQDNSRVTYELIDVINEWLQHHLMYIDMKYVPTFRKHGLN